MNLGKRAPRKSMERGAIFYILLWAIAEDWGGYEPNFHTIAKQSGFIEFTSKEVEHFIKILIDKKKVIPFSTETGKKIHWLKNLSNHQRLNTPPVPSLPLPPWIECTISKYKNSNRLYAKYKFIERELLLFLERSNDNNAVSTQSASSLLEVYERETETEKETDKGNDINRKKAESAFSAPSSDKEISWEKAFKNSERRLKELSQELIEHYQISWNFDANIKHQQNKFHPVGFLFHANKSQIPVPVILDVLESMARQKEKINNPYAWLTTVLEREHSEYNYTQELKAHEERKSWSLNSIKRLFT